MLGRQKKKDIEEPVNDLQCILLGRARLLKEKDNVFTICFHHEQFFWEGIRKKS